MRIWMNGEPVELADGMILAGVLEENGIPIAQVVVERNGAIVPREEFEQQVVEDGDRLEVVRIVGGG